MKHAFCFQCRQFVPVVLEHNLECGHALSEQQAQFEAMVLELDRDLETLITRFDHTIPGEVMHSKARDIACEIINEFLLSEDAPAHKGHLQLAY